MVEPTALPRRRAKKGSILAELREDPGRIDTAVGLRTRVLRISAELIAQAEAAEWKVVRDESWYKARPNWQRSNSAGPALFKIDAGHEAVGVTFKSFKDSRTSEVRLRLVLGSGYPGYKVDDSKLTYIEDKLARVLDRIAAMSLAAQKRHCVNQEMHRKMEEERQQKIAFQKRFDSYAAWRTSLMDLKTRWAEHEELGRFVDELEQRTRRLEDEASRASVDQFVEWAKRYVAELDPFHGFDLPAGDAPDLTYDQWRDGDRRGLGKRPFGYGYHG